MAITYELIQTYTLGTNTTTVTFSSIPQTYDHLVLNMSNRSTRSDWIDECRVIINNNAAAYYPQTGLFGYATTTVSAASQTNRSYVGNVEMAGASTVSNNFSNSEIWFQDYKNTNMNRTFMWRTAVNNNQYPSTPSQNLVSFGGGHSQFTTAITSLVCNSATSNQIATGSTLSLYGIKQA